MAHPHITINGNLTEPVELHFTSDGTPVANFRLATNAYRRNTNGTWEQQGEPCYWQCEAWRDRAEAIAAQDWPTGTPLTVEGTITQETYEHNDKTRLAVTVEVHTANLDLLTQHRRNNKQ